MSDSPTSPGLNGSLQPRQLKKRKPTYLVRREEAKALEDQVHALQKQLAALQEAKDSNNIALIAAKNEMMRASLHSQQLAMASLQSMMFHHVSNQSENPLYTYIHLPQQRAARRETLVDMKDDKLLQCYNYLMARSGNLNMVKDHYAGDKYEDANGNLVCHRFDVTHFRGLKSLKQVYDALVFFMFNMEISISETLGDITVRDDYDSINDGAYISNHRLISNHESGVTSEANTATFAQYFDGPNQ
ncbi:unnamed protein product [Phytophthora lilii]|uniref:Unnamed protein product n=1 Tax=Phytophthora lilii TaxID=2077276 RepID=A0A9W6TYP4_9STRA|nr:unnamed protein product [Phytophthora lilii]